MNSIFDMVKKCHFRAKTGIKKCSVLCELDKITLEKANGLNFELVCPNNHPLYLHIFRGKQFYSGVRNQWTFLSALIQSHNTPQ